MQTARPEHKKTGALVMDEKEFITKSLAQHRARDWRALARKGVPPTISECALSHFRGHSDDRESPLSTRTDSPSPNPLHRTLTHLSHPQASYLSPTFLTRVFRMRHGRMPHGCRLDTSPLRRHGRSLSRVTCPTTNPCASIHGERAKRMYTEKRRERGEVPNGYNMANQLCLASIQNVFKDPQLCNHSLSRTPWRALQLSVCAGLSVNIKTE